MTKLKNYRQKNYLRNLFWDSQIGKALDFESRDV